MAFLHLYPPPASLLAAITPAGGTLVIAGATQMVSQSAGSVPLLIKLAASQSGNALTVYDSTQTTVFASIDPTGKAFFAGGARLTTTSTAGQVWAASDTNGNGAWQSLSSSGLTGDTYGYHTPSGLLGIGLNAVQHVGLAVVTPDTTGPTALFRAIASQSGNLTEWQATGGGSVVASVSVAGDLSATTVTTSGTTTTKTYAFRHTASVTTTGANLFGTDQTGITLTPANTFAATFDAVGGTVNLGAGVTAPNVYGTKIGTITKTGTGAATTLYGLYVDQQTAGATNWVGYFNGAVNIQGIITAGSGNTPITNSAGLVDATKLTGMAPLANGGTNAATAAGARTNLGVNHYDLDCNIVGKPTGGATYRYAVGEAITLTAGTNPGNCFCAAGTNAASVNTTLTLYRNSTGSGSIGTAVFNTSGTCTLTVSATTTFAAKDLLLIVVPSGGSLDTTLADLTIFLQATF